MYKKYTALCKPYCIPIKLFRIMKLSVLLLVTAFLQVAGAASYAQKLTMDKRNASLKSILKELEAKTGYNFIYNTNMLNRVNDISFTLKDVSLEEVLNKSLENQALSYTINGNTVVITQKEVVLQPKKPIIIKGKVVDKNNEPLPGVGVKIKNTNVMEVTNVNGEYSIRVTDPKAILVFKPKRLLLVSKPILTLS